MSKLITLTAILVLAGLSPALARGGGGGIGGIHGSGSSAALSAPANPSVPPSLTSDPRVTGSAPLPLEHPASRAAVAALPGIAIKTDAEDVRLDRMIKNICRGC